MQLEGGYNWRPLTWRIFKISTLLCFVIVFLIAVFKKSLLQFFCLFLNLEGTLMWVFSLSPEGGLPPPEKWKDKISWFFQLARGYPVTINPKMLYVGVSFVLLSAILQALFQ